MGYHKEKVYNRVQFNDSRNLISIICTKNSKTHKILVIIFVILIAMLISGFEKSFGAELETKSTEVTQENGETVKYEYDTDGTQALNVRLVHSGIDGVSRKPIPNKIYIPETLDGLPVCTLGDGTKNIFEGNSLYKVEKITFPRTLGAINPNALSELIFYTDINLPENLRYIGENAFKHSQFYYNYFWNKELVIPDNVTTIGKNAFEHRSWENTYEYKIANDESKIVFNCSFKNIVLGKNLSSIEEGTFMGNFYLESITIHNKITSIGEKAFYNCSSLSNINIESGTGSLRINNLAFAGTGVRSINTERPIILGDSVFSGCGRLEEVTFKLAGSKINNETFRNCSSLNSINIQGNITEIGDYAFLNCKKLTTELYNKIVTKVTKIGTGSFKDCTGLTGLIEIKSIVKTLGEGAFSNCSNIEEVNFQCNIYKIPNSCFYKCSHLSGFTKTDGTKEVGNDAFYKCNNINNTILENNILYNVQTIGSAAFYGINNLKGTLNISSTIQTIGSSAFGNCNNITSVNFANSTNLKEIGDNAFYISQNLGVIDIPSTKMNTIGSKAFKTIDEIFFASNCYNRGSRFYGLENVFSHFAGCKHHIDVTCELPGIKLMNVTTGTEFENGDYNCRQTQNFKLVIEDGYSYPDLAVKVISEGKYTNSEPIEEYITLNNENEFSLENLIRSKKIIIQRCKDGTDLVLREFISEVNGTALSESKEPKVKVSADTIKNIAYNHSKYPTSVNVGDEVTFNIRVYNEGKAKGKANEISVMLLNGLEFLESNEMNKKYGWKVNDSGSIISTQYLSNTEIEEYNGSGKPSYEEIRFVCKVGEQLNQNMCALAKITDGNDIDSILEFPNVNLEEWIEKCYNSNRDMYFMLGADDTDIDMTALRSLSVTGYNLVVNKVDISTNELLNGAKFNLYNENMEKINTGMCENGSVNFGSFTSFGEGKDIYYIEEEETPIGYKRTINGKVKLTVEKTIGEDGTLQVRMYCDVDESVLDIPDEEKIADVEDSYFEIDGFSENGFEVQFEDWYQSEENYIPIYTVEQLKKIGVTTQESVTINGKEYLFKPGCYYKLMNDITLEEPWEPFNFKGTFDGNNFTIKNMRIDNECSFITDGISSKNKIGFFEDVQGVIKNLNFENASISIEQGTGNQTGGGIGIICGSMRGILDNCNVKNSTISANNLINVGGLVGMAYDKLNIKNSEFNNSIQGHSNVGGLVGGNIANLYITGSSVTGPIVKAHDSSAGGMIGCNNFNAVIINNTLNVGTVEAEKNNAGGIIGVTNNGRLKIYKNTMGNGTNITTKLSKCGGIIGLAENSNIDIKECNNNSRIQAGESDAGGIIGNLKGKLRIQNLKTNNGIFVSQCNAGGFIGQTMRK